MPNAITRMSPLATPHPIASASNGDIPADRNGPQASSTTVSSPSTIPAANTTTRAPPGGTGRSARRFGNGTVRGLTAPHQKA